MNTLSPQFGRKTPLFKAGVALALAALALPLSTNGVETSTETKSGEKPLDVKITLNQDKLVRGEEQDVIIKIDLVAAKPKSGGKRLPLNLAVVLDRSGSMEGAKLEQAKQAAAMLVDRLEEDDVFSLVTYDSEVDVKIPATKVGDNAESWQRQIRRIESGGSTALYAGVESGGEQLREYLKKERMNRVILLSDGLANVGKKSPREISRLGRDLADDGIGVTTIGLGADFNEDLMTALAEASDANYYYVEDVEKLPGVFAEELGQLNNIVARDVEIRIILPEGVKPVEIMGRSEKFSGREATIRLSHFNASQRREILVKAQLTPGKDADTADLAQVSTRYLDELDGGKEDNLNRDAQASVTDDRKAAESSKNDEVVLRVIQMETDKAKTEAANLAVAGDKEGARLRLNRQQEYNSSMAQSLPAPAAAQVSDENTQLDQYSTDFDQQEGKDLSESVKRAKAESWTRAQSK